MKETIRTITALVLIAWCFVALLVLIGEDMKGVSSDVFFLMKLGAIFSLIPVYRFFKEIDKE